MPVLQLMRGQPAYIEMVVQEAADFWLNLAIVTTANPRTLLNMSGWTATAKIRGSYDGSTIVEMTSGNGRVSIGTFGTAPNQYNVQIYIPASVTSVLTDWGDGVWDIRFNDTLNRKYKYAEGPARFSRSASR